MTGWTLDFATVVADERHPHIGMAPLVDIVLLLICFYLLVMQSIQNQVDARVQLPVVSGHRTTEIRPAELVINIDVAGTITLNGEAVDEAALLRLLHLEQDKALWSGRRISVVIRADARQTFDALDGAMAVCREAGISTVVVRTQESRSQ
jgi:biopolymer transport protein ExbD